MDQSFSLNPHGSARVSDRAVTLADIKAAADERREILAHCVTAGFLRGQEEEPDLVHILACNIVPDGGGLIDTVSLSGSFNPLVARQLMVGTI